MNREIKFRVWTGIAMDYNIMAGFLGIFYVQGIDEKDKACMSPFNTQYSESCPVMQFTGFKDKNGKDIYEGDICKQLLPSMRDDGTEVNDIEQIDSVEYKDGQFEIDSYPLYVCADFELEVVGNIYANPELLS